MMLGFNPNDLKNSLGILLTDNVKFNETKAGHFPGSALCHGCFTTEQTAAAWQ